MKSVQIQSFFFGKYGPEKTPYLDTFHAVQGSPVELSTDQRIFFF